MDVSGLVATLEVTLKAASKDLREIEKKFSDLLRSLPDDALQDRWVSMAANDLANSIHAAQHHVSSASGELHAIEIAANECEESADTALSLLPAVIYLDPQNDDAAAEVVSWCEYNLRAAYNVGRLGGYRWFGFVDETDAVHFKLRWGELCQTTSGDK